MKNWKKTIGWHFRENLLPLMLGVVIVVVFIVVVALVWGGIIGGAILIIRAITGI